MAAPSQASAAPGFPPSSYTEGPSLAIIRRLLRLAPIVSAYHAGEQTNNLPPLATLEKNIKTTPYRYRPKQTYQ